MICLQYYYNYSDDSEHGGRDDVHDGVGNVDDENADCDIDNNNDRVGVNGVDGDAMSVNAIRNCPMQSFTASRSGQNLNCLRSWKTCAWPLSRKDRERR